MQYNSKREIFNEKSPLNYFEKKNLIAYILLSQKKNKIDLKKQKIKINHFFFNRLKE